MINCPNCGASLSTSDTGDLIPCRGCGRSFRAWEKVKEAFSFIEQASSEAHIFVIVVKVPPDLHPELAAHIERHARTAAEWLEQRLNLRVTGGFKVTIGDEVKHG